MSIYDRGYMNGTEESAHAGRKYSAVIVLIIVNAAVWILWQIAFSREGELLDFMRSQFLLRPQQVIYDFKIHQLLTCAFSHHEPMHILFNMLFLWYIGEDVERIYGHRNFIWLYIFCGVSASLAFIGLEAIDTGGDLRRASPMLGASGAVCGIMVVAAIFDPNKPMSIFGLIPVTLRTLATIYIILDVLGVMNKSSREIQSRVANIAHLGGALAGFIYWKMDLRIFSAPGRTQVGFWHKVKGLFRRKPGLRVVEKNIPQEMPREPVAQGKSARAGAAAASSRTSGRVDAATAERVDQLLDKIHNHGIQNLTDEEREFLNRSSQKYKRD